MPQQAQLPSRRLNTLVTVLGLVGLILFLALYDDAFPSAAIDLTISRDEIAQRAEAYLTARGFDVQGYEFALTFEQAFWGSTYLQRTVGIPETNRLIRDEKLPLWYWRARWFRPLQKEEFAVSLAPDGSLVAFDHSIPEDLPGAALDQEQARALAADYLTGDRAWSLADWEPVSASSQDRPGGRVDHHFEWKRRDWAVGESELRLAVDVQGDRVDTYDYWIKTPESFIRQFSEQFSRASFIDNTSTTIGDVAFLGAALVAYIFALWRGAITWKAGLRPALFAGAVSLLAGLNALPLYKAGYVTTQDYGIFWTQRVLNLLSGALFVAALVLIMWPGGLLLAKKVWPRRDKILPRSDERWLTLSRSAWRGLMLGGMWGGYAVLFYLIATRIFGGWMPLGVDNPGGYATPLPFLDALRTGILPAMHEELQYRLVGISLVVLFTRRRWLALVVPGALWAFAHLTYIRDPFYLRGIELTIHAVVLAGLVFLRFDLTTTMMAHFTYNASLGALPLIRSGESFFVLSGAIVIACMLVPVAPGVALAMRRRWRAPRVQDSSPQVVDATVDDLHGLQGLPIEGVDWQTALTDPEAYVVCLRMGTEIAGVAIGRLNAEGTVEVRTVFVAPAWRREYWGSRLVDELMARMRGRGARSIQAAVPTKDTVAVAFWASQGWRQAVKVFSRPLVSPTTSTPKGFRERIRRILRKLAEPID